MWPDKIYQYLAPIKNIRKIKGLSERVFSDQADISRMSLRSAESGTDNITLETLAHVVSSLDRELLILAVPTDMRSEYSALAVSMKVERDGFESWMQHFFDLVDEFRRTLDPRLVLLPPDPGLDGKLKALLASIVLDLCDEVKMDAPSWAKKAYPLPEPWFLSETESLKASSLVESPAYYRRNNIFVLENFLRRA